MIIKQDLAPVLPGKNCFGYGNKKKYITIHQTGNSARGADAQMHADYQINNATYPVPREASWHYTVDDTEAIQSFEHGVSCWHASDGNGDGNVNSIGIEGCINTDGNYVQTVKNMAELTAFIMKQEGIPIENIKDHFYWDDLRIKKQGLSSKPKNCPTQIREGKEGIDWNKFIEMVKQSFALLNGKPLVESAKVVAPKPVVKPNLTSAIEKKYAENAVFYPDRTIYVYNQPSTSGKKLAEYYKGESVKYHTVHIGNGHVWIEYNRSGGGKGYMPIRTYQNGVYGSLLGVIKDEVVVIKPVSKIERKYTEAGVFYPDRTIKVYDQPFEHGNHVATYYKGENVTYHYVHLGNGYVWLEYRRSNGQSGYIACRTYSNGKYGPLWGTIR